MDQETFVRLAGTYTVVPVSEEAVADEETPISLFRRLGDGPGRFLLESAEGGERLGRYSFLGLDPAATLTARGRGYRIVRAGGEVEDGEGSPLDGLRQLLRPYRAYADPVLPRFFGGAVGYLGYDLVRHLEHLPHRPPDDRGLPDAVLVVPRVVLILDHVTRRLRVVVNQEVGRDPQAAWAQAQKTLRDVWARLRGPRPAVSPAPSRSRSSLPRIVGRTLDQRAYEERVRRALEYIAAGDIFQVVPSQRLEVEVSASPLDQYRALRSINPSPYLFYLNFGHFHLIGSSPEVLVRVEGGKVTVRPIAGTRPRAGDPEEDRRREAELRADEKERAEHIMLVDLGRNDVGRISRYGSVAVPELMVVERYSHVMHLVSEVTGELAPGRDALDVLAACFPAGTVSGAPKVRAMEIIDELEPVARGPYAGAVGYVGYHGNLDTCIAIRTVVRVGDRAYLQAGGGIVADSDPPTEYRETMAKAQALLKALEMAERGELL